MRIYRQNGAMIALKCRVAVSGAFVIVKTAARSVIPWQQKSMFDDEESHKKSGIAARAFATITKLPRGGGDAKKCWITDATVGWREDMCQVCKFRPHFETTESH